MRAIHEFGQEILPGWLQCTTEFIEYRRWTELKKYDLVVSIFKGSNDIANQTIGIYNNWIFDMNERVAILLYQEGLDYCVNTKDASNKFVSSTGGFSFQKIVIKEN